MSRISVSEARAALPEVLDRVHSGEEITITRHGQPVAVVVRPDALRSRRADGALAGAQRARTLLTTGGQRPLPSTVGLTTERAEQLIAEIRAGRGVR